MPHALTARGKVVSPPVSEIVERASSGISLSLQAKSRTWLLCENVDLEAQISNVSSKALILLLGTYTGTTDGGTALAAVALQVEELALIPLLVAVSPGHYMTSVPENLFDDDDSLCWATNVGNEGDGVFVFDSQNGALVVLHSVEWRDFGDDAGIAEMSIEADVDGVWQRLAVWPCSQTSATQVHYFDEHVMARRWRMALLRPHGRGGFVVRTLRFFAQVFDPQGDPCWLGACARQPRSVLGEPPVAQRPRALFLPAGGAVSLPFRGRVISAGPGASAGAALRFCGSSGADAAHVLLPLPGSVSNASSRSTCSSASSRHRLRLRLVSAPIDPEEAVERSLEHGMHWVGPHVPSQPLTSIAVWHGLAMSAPLQVVVQSHAGRNHSSGHQLVAHSIEDLGVTTRRGPCGAVRPPRRRPSAVTRSLAPRRRSASHVRPVPCNAVEDTVEETPEPELPRKQAMVRDLKTPRLPPLARSLRTTLEHGTCWRGLARHQDPLVDPGLLDLAEVVYACAMRAGTVNSTTVAVCSDRMRGRSGQRLVTSMRATGLSVLPGQDLRTLAAWLEAPRHVASPVDFVLVTDWCLLSPSLVVIGKIRQESGLQARLLGIVAICSRHEEENAKSTNSSIAVAAATFGVGGVCPCICLPSLAL